MTTARTIFRQMLRDLTSDPSLRVETASAVEGIITAVADSNTRIQITIEIREIQQ